MSPPVSVFEQLMATIEDRRQKMPEGSYTTHLFQGGVARIGAKISEEAQEVIEAADQADTADGRAHLIHEAADLLYHLFVLLGYREISLDEVTAELARRFGTSGLAEKAARPQSSSPE